MPSTAYAVCLLARRQAGLSQRELATASGVSASTIARIERGRMEPTLAIVERLVAACGLELRMSLGPLPPGVERPLSIEDRLRENDRLTALHREAAAPRAR